MVMEIVTTKLDLLFRTFGRTKTTRRRLCPLLSTKQLSSFNCQHCSFLSLCTTDINGYAGRDLLIRSMYEPNTYGYTDDIEGELV